jgi:2-iminobutanoate/2-iminopropanoate deaminase
MDAKFTIIPVRTASPGFSLGGKPVHGAQAAALEGEYRLVWTSGQVATAGADGAGRGEIEDQVHAVLRSLGAVLEAAGGGFASVVKLMAWLPRREHVPVYAKIRKGYFGDHAPASTSVISELVEPDMLIEVEAIAAVSLSAG